jgi:hypothetical protein
MSYFADGFVLISKLKLLIGEAGSTEFFAGGNYYILMSNWMV